MSEPHISTHILDTSRGLPAPDVPIKLYKFINNNWSFISESKTSSNGRCGDLLDIGNEILTVSQFKLVFEVKKYFELIKINSLYPVIEVIIEIKDATKNYHLPLLLNPFGYSTYRGS